MCYNINLKEPWIFVVYLLLATVLLLDSRLNDEHVIKYLFSSNDIDIHLVILCFMIYFRLYIVSSINYIYIFCWQLLDLPGIIEGAKDGKGRGRQVTCELV